MMKLMKSVADEALKIIGKAKKSLKQGLNQLREKTVARGEIVYIKIGFWLK